MSEIKNVSGTAFIIAEFRAEENAAPEPLYRDEIVELFLDQNSKQVAHQVAQSFPLVLRIEKVDNSRQGSVSTNERRLLAGFAIP